MRPSVPSWCSASGITRYATTHGPQAYQSHPGPDTDSLNLME